MEKFKCFLCIGKYSNIEDILKHLKIKHFIKEKSNPIKCIVNSNVCDKEFATFSGLKKHTEKCLERNGPTENEIETANVESVQDITDDFNEKMTISEVISDIFS